MLGCEGPIQSNLVPSQSPVASPPVAGPQWPVPRGRCPVAGPQWPVSSGQSPSGVHLMSCLSAIQLSAFSVCCPVPRVDWRKTFQGFLEKNESFLLFQRWPSRGGIAACPRPRTSSTGRILGLCLEMALNLKKQIHFVGIGLGNIRTWLEHACQGVD